jgi:hypothetical protein
MEAFRQKVEQGMATEMQQALPVELMSREWKLTGRQAFRARGV